MRNRRRSALALVLAAMLMAGAAGLRPPVTRAATPAPDLSQIGQLTYPATDEGLEGTAVSGGTVFAGAPASTFGELGQGAVFVYPEPSGGALSSAPAATLVASDPSPDDQLGTVVKADGPTLVTGGDQPVGSGEIRVFTEPSGGWSGTIEQSASLVAPHVRLFSPILEDNTIVALGQYAGDATTPAVDEETYLYVFTEPSGGWSGLEGPSAVLTPPAEASISDSGDSVAVGAGEIVAGSGPANAVYVFNEPAGGWAGTVSPAATLTTSAAYTGDQLGWSVALDGATVVAGEADPRAGTDNGTSGAFAFQEPAGGWSGTVAPSARLTAPGVALFSAEPNFGGDGIAFAGSTLLIPSGVVEAYTLPSGGWSGTVTPTATLTGTAGQALTAVSSDGSTAFASTAPALGGGAPASSDFASIQAVTSGPVSADGLLSSAAPTDVFTDVGQASGAVAPAATLTPATIGSGVNVATFTEPAGGWISAGPSATLAPPSPLTSPDPLSQVGDPSSVAVSWSVDPGAATTAAATVARVYSTPASGWSDGVGSAQLVDPGGLSLRDLATGSGFAVAVAVVPEETEHEPPPEQVDAFTEPAGGWGGTVTGTTLATIPSGEYVEDLTASGNLLVLMLETASGGLTEQVYTEGAGGWSAGLGTPAQLTNVVNARDLSTEVSFAGDSIIVGAQAGGRTVAATTSAEVFTEPARGWTGTVSPAATLTVPAAGSWLFTEPAGGWRGALTPAARLAQGTIGAVSSDGRTIAITRTVVIGQPVEHGTPTDGSQLSLAGEPAAGWHGVLSGTGISATALTYDERPATELIAGDLFVSGDEPTVDIYRVGQVHPARLTIPRKPGIATAALSGVSTGRPRLTLATDGGTDISTALTLTLPAGLSVTRSVNALRAAIPACRLRDTSCTAPRAGQLRIRLKPNLLVRTGLTITIAPAVLHESANLKRSVDAAVAYDRRPAHPQARSVTLAVKLAITDVLGVVTRRTATFRVQSSGAVRPLRTETNPRH